MIIKNQLTTQYYEQQKEQARAQLSSLVQQLNEDILYLSQVDASVKSNVNILRSIYTKDDWYSYQLANELAKYDDSSVLINSIVAQINDSETVLSTNVAVTEADGVYHFYHNNQSVLQFEPASYLDSGQSQLICISDNDHSMLIYFPVTSKSQPYIIFYILDTEELSQTLGNLISSEMLTLAMVDSDCRIAAGANEQLLSSCLQDIPLVDGFYELDSSDSLCVQTGVSGGFTLVALLSNSSILDQINAALLNYYRLITLLGLIGFMLILFSLRITWTPLHKLTKKNVPEVNFSQSFLEQLDQSFTKFKEENTELRCKLDNYRQSMQKALLDSCIASNSVDIDQFFETDAGNEIYIICVHSNMEKLPYSEILEHFYDYFPGENPCVLVEQDSYDAVFLLNYIGQEPNKADVLMDVLAEYLGEKGYFAAISNGSNSALDIPSLYENAKAAAKYWDDDHRMIDYSALKLEPSALTYPGDKLEQLSSYLTAKNFSAARAVLAELFAIIDAPLPIQSAMPDFFVRCILVDILTEMGKSLEESNIRFKDYSDLYFEALYSCRSCAYTTEKWVIADKIYRLLDFYEQSIPRKIVDPDYLRKVMKDSFRHPDFSISALAEHFHVSIAYMSHLTKKELGMNFVDYLWELRLKHAQKLLKNSSLSVDEISIEVGYLNPSSFRRKFKQATGITPSQYRAEAADLDACAILSAQDSSAK